VPRAALLAPVKSILTSANSTLLGPGMVATSETACTACRSASSVLSNASSCDRSPVASGGGSFDSSTITSTRGFSTAIPASAPLAATTVDRGTGRKPPGRMRELQLCRVGVHADELDTAEAGLDHPIDHIAPAAPNTDNLDPRMRPAGHGCGTIRRHGSASN